MGGATSDSVRGRSGENAALMDVSATVAGTCAGSRLDGRREWRPAHVARTLGRAATAARQRAVRFVFLDEFGERLVTLDLDACGLGALIVRASESPASPSR